MSASIERPERDGESEDNPFAAPQVTSLSERARFAPPPSPIVTLGLIVAVIDLIVCPLRAADFMQARLGAFLDHPEFAAVNLWPSFATMVEVGIIATAIPAAVGLLARRAWGVRIGYAAAVFTALSIAGTILGALRAHFGPSPFYRPPYSLLNDAMPIAFRAAMLAIYVAALRRYPAYLLARAQGSAATE